jgi:hypothetical protein
MSRGDYSPTVRAAYRIDPYCHQGVVDENGMESRYDVEGYDMYGYDMHGIDRAGFSASEYDMNSIGVDDCCLEYNADFDREAGSWTFDGIRPTKIHK